MAAIVNLVAMQISWFACVLGAANGLPWLGVIVSVGIVVQHLMRIADKATECKLILSAVVIGCIVDSALAHAGVIEFNSGSVVDGWTAPWMIGLWMGFATALTGVLRAIVLRMGVSVVFGAIGGPLAYWSGAKLGAIELGAAPLSFVLIGIGWAVSMALFSLLVRKLDSPRRKEAYA